MNRSIVYKLLSIILLALTVALIGSFAVAYFYDRDDSSRALIGFFLSACITGAGSLVFHLMGRKGSHVMYSREALAVVGLGWICASLFGALPYYLIHPEMTVGDAVFESTSGITTTGASVLSNLESLPSSLLFWRAITQWIGGLGVVVFFVAVLSFLGAGAKVLFSRESTGQVADLESPRIQQGIFRLMYFYFGLSVACTLTFYLLGMEIFEAVAHMFTTVSTGGFSTRSASVAAFESPAIEWAFIVFMLLGGTCFVPMLRATQGDFSALRKSTEIKWYYGIMLLATFLVGFFLLIDRSFSFDTHEIVRGAAFQVVSIMTTSGFATHDFQQWLPSTHVVLILLMAIGGCSGSTSGGAKVIRAVIAAKICLMHIEKAFRNRVVRTLRINGEPVDSSTQESVLVFLVLLAMLTLLSGLALALVEPSLSLEGLLSAMFACLFNIGPGFAEVGPAENYGHLNSAAKFLLSLLMILGRVELFAILALFAPSLWRKF